MATLTDQFTNGFAVLPSWVVADPGLSDRQVRLMMILSRLTHGRGEWWISHADLGKLVGCSPTAVKDALNGRVNRDIRSMVEPHDGRPPLILRQTRQNEGGGSGANLYRLNFDAWAGCRAGPPPLGASAPGGGRQRARGPGALAPPLTVGEPGSNQPPYPPRGGNR